MKKTLNSITKNVDQAATENIVDTSYHNHYSHTLQNSWKCGEINTGDSIYFLLESLDAWKFIGSLVFSLGSQYLD